MNSTIKAMAAVMILSATATLAGGCYTVQKADLTPGQRANQLANGVTLASGANALPKVHTIAFTFVVRDGDAVKVSRTHLWNLRAQTDAVTVGDKTTTIDLRNPKADDPAEADAFKAWTNDAYWLAAPLKLFDQGVTRQYLGTREIAGKAYEVLQLSFQGVGLTPGDRYNLYVDPYTSLVAHWDYMPSADTTMPATWGRYQHKSGLKLSTHHVMGTKTITIEDLVVQAE